MNANVQIVLQVVLPDATLQSRVEECLRGAGFAVWGEAQAPHDYLLGTVTGVTQITAREQEVLALLPSRDGSKEIARQLGVHPKVVDGHIQRLMGKFGVSSRHRLVLRALACGLLGETAAARG